MEYTPEDQRLLHDVNRQVSALKHDVQNLKESVNDVRSDQKALTEIATNLGVMTEKVKNIEYKVENTNEKIEEFSEKINDIEKKPLEEKSNNIDSIGIAVITAVCTFLATTFIGTLI